MHKLYRLAQTFHALADCPTGEDFDPVAFAKWAGDRQMGNGGVWAALFVLSVWNDKLDWAGHGLGMPTPGAFDPRGKVGRFYMHDALGTWDYPHRAAFRVWVNCPWWC